MVKAPYKKERNRAKPTTHISTVDKFPGKFLPPTIFFLLLLSYYVSDQSYRLWQSPVKIIGYE